MPPSRPPRSADLPPIPEDDFRQILGIRFYIGQLDGLLELTMKGGLVAVPSAPVLTRMPEDRAHREAVEGSDFAITDSGFMVLLWLALRRERLVRISGLRYLQSLLGRAELRAPGATFWVMPSQEDATANLAWLAGQGIPVDETDTYLGPIYSRTGPLHDAELLAVLEKRRPRFVILNLGGGVQERLGHFLRQRLSYQPAIICTGAAIAFLSGRQTNIPTWADRFFLGWLFRLLSDPARFWPRYWHALRLVPLLVKHGSASVAV